MLEEKRYVNILMGVFLLKLHEKLKARHNTKSLAMRYKVYSEKGKYLDYISDLSNLNLTKTNDKIPNVPEDFFSNYTSVQSWVFKKTFSGK